MNVTFEKFRNSSLMPDLNVTWWVELAETVDQLRESAWETFAIGDVPVELRPKLDLLNRQTQNLCEELQQLRRTVARYAGQPEAVSHVRELARETFGEWERHARRVSAFLTETHWRDLGVAG